MSVCVSPLVQPTTLMTELETLTCPQCPKSFTSTKMLQQHQQMFHTDKSILFTLKSTDAQAGMDRAFICETCGKAFRFRSNLAEHRSVHTALKPYVCKFCGKSSRLKGNLTKHILKHHKKEQNEAIAKDDIIVKKAPKVIKTEPGTSSNGTTATTSTATTATAVIITSSTGTNGNSQNGHNNNNNHNTINNNLTTIKTEIEDPDYVSMAVPTKSTTFAAKVVPSSPTKSRAQQRDTSVVPNIPTPVMIVEAQPEESSFLPKDLTTDFERNILISLGLDFATSMKIPESMKPAKTIKKELAASPDSIRSENSDDEPDSPPLPNMPTVGGSETLAMIFAAANASIQQQQQLQQRRASSPDSTLSMRGGSPSREVSPESDESTSSNESCPSPTKFLTCKECGKIIRKSSHLPIHMTLSHGFPPPAATVDIVPEKKLNGMGDIDVESELHTIALAIADLKAAQAAAPKVEDALTFIDTRVGNLEKSLETALNSIYTLVQLQSGMTSSVNRLREDSARHFNELKERMDRSWSPRRISRRDSSPQSVSRDRSRSPI
ncbi:hypothetical protein L5515_018194 [Caenorhabditis briggsae]|uniref:C2H2-type domain-containing protein n=1 Tax=Caenorhabditis briggsae TaxID=6238 RepID=A0AAE8ZYQ6_CAEBR|nr:hypothetical protein L3Y34_012336 [Caenorhabditis briggsae]UMM42325.1 hypothetical protein L5515_018194 [Caenorhabditis briggsae]